MTRSLATPGLLMPTPVTLSTSRNARPHTMNVLATLRALSPRRPLTDAEAIALAERQAARLLDMAALTAPAVPSALITELPRVLVELRADLPVSAAAHWVNGRWLLLINSGEPLERQRFSLAHEYKHCVDHPLRLTIYQGTAITGPTAQGELAADAFAAALLMPEPWLGAQLSSGLLELAERFQVSAAAMERRLATLNSADPTPKEASR